MLGALHKSPKDIDQYTLADIELAYIGYHNARMYAERANWERARYMAYHCIAPFTDKVRNPQALGRFSWEVPSESIKEKLVAMKHDKRFPQHI